LTWLRDEFEPLCAQLLARHPCVSLMDALAEVHNEVTHLQDSGLLRSSSVLAAHSLFAHPVAHVPLASASVALSAAHAKSGILYCDHCSWDEHVEAFCYRKKKAEKAQTCYSSQGIGDSDSEGSKRISAGLGTQEFLMLLHPLATSTSLGAIGFVTQPSALTSFATASQSFTLGPHSTPLGTYPWYLDSDASFHMTPHSTHLSSLWPSYQHCTIHTADGSSLSVVGQGTLCCNSFHVPDVSFVPDFTMKLMSAGQITDYDCCVILDPDFCYKQDHHTGHLVGTGPHRCDL
jgi:hypothetical protein